jgi:hypothetical protein
MQSSRLPTSYLARIDRHRCSCGHASHNPESPTENYWEGIKKSSRECLNTLVVLSPWLAVIGFVGCVGTVVVVARKCRVWVSHSSQVPRLRQRPSTSSFPQQVQASSESANHVDLAEVKRRRRCWPQLSPRRNYRRAVTDSPSLLPCSQSTDDP